MSKVQEIAAAIQKLTAEEIREVQEWLEEFAEDQMEFKPEFQAGIDESKKLMSSGAKPRVRRFFLREVPPIDPIPLQPPGYFADCYSKSEIAKDNRLAKVS